MGVRMVYSRKMPFNMISESMLKQYKLWNVANLDVKLIDNMGY